MPARCCVTSCNSNYDGTDVYVSVFKFPKDPTLRCLWIRKIPRKDFIPSDRSVVCEKHFREEEVLKFDDLPTSDGIIKVKRDRPKLKVGAIPSLFPGCPIYLSAPKKSSKKESREEKLKKIDKQSFEKFVQSDKITGLFSEFQQSLPKKIQCLADDHIILVNLHQQTCILFVELDSKPTICKSLKIKCDMTINVFVGTEEIEERIFSHLLENGKVAFWSQIENIISLIKGILLEDVEKDNFKASLENWKLHTAKSVQSEKYLRNTFLLEQMHLSTKDKFARRYSSDLFQFACCSYMISPSCYRSLLSSELLCLPSVASLKKMLSTITLKSSTTSLENIKYIKEKCDKLEEKEKFVSLLIDEIHIKKKITYKGRQVTGFAENQDDETEATSVQSFMISSCFSKYKEVVGLVPVHKMTAQNLYMLTIQTLSLLDQAGFKVVCIISDNNSVNRNMFKSFSNGSLSSDAVKNPVNGTDLFLIFDSVHLLKSIRNNWINQLDTEKTFICPSFNGEKEYMHPRFGLLRKVFHIEKDMPIKYAHHLTLKALYPTSMERQNVLPAVKIFHESNAAALERLSTQVPTIHTVEDTCFFLRLVKKWWDIMNISHPNKGKFTRNSDSKPISSTECESLSFLTAFVDWLKKWRSLKQKARCGCLTDETFIALIHTSATIVNMARNLLQGGANYILTAKFQTDSLEFRFSQYRQMSGSNYHVSLQQICESEKKLRIKSMLKLHSSRFGDIPLRLFISDMCLTPTDDIDLSPFIDIIDELTLNLSTSEAEVLTYIGGYCVSKLKLTCELCKFFYYGAFTMSVDIEEELEVLPHEGLHHTTYLDLINRGGMKTPSANVVYTLSVSYSIFEKLICNQYEKLFITFNNRQHTVIAKLTELYLQECCVFNLDEMCLHCCTSISFGIKKIINTFANILLNNYAKNKTNQSAIEKKVVTKKDASIDNRKVKKFKK